MAKLNIFLNHSNVNRISATVTTDIENDGVRQYTTLYDDGLSIVICKDRKAKNVASTKLVKSSLLDLNLVEEVIKAEKSQHPELNNDPEIWVGRGATITGNSVMYRYDAIRSTLMLEETRRMYFFFMCTVPSVAFHDFHEEKDSRFYNAKVRIEGFEFGTIRARDMSIENDAYIVTMSQGKLKKIKAHTAWEAIVEYMSQWVAENSTSKEKLDFHFATDCWLTADLVKAGINGKLPDKALELIINQNR